jgi:hypothetical protein
MIYFYRGCRKTNKKSHHRKKSVKKTCDYACENFQMPQNFHHQEAAKIGRGNGLIAAEILSVNR